MLDAGHIQVNIQLRPVKVVVADLRDGTDLLYRRGLEPREILKSKKGLSAVNPQPKASRGDVKYLKVRNDGSSALGFHCAVLG